MQTQSNNTPIKSNQVHLVQMVNNKQYDWTNQTIRLNNIKLQVLWHTVS